MISGKIDPEGTGTGDAFMWAFLLGAIVGFVLLTWCIRNTYRALTS